VVTKLWAIVSVAAALAPAVGLAGCGDSSTPAFDVVQSYVSAVAEGNGVSACGMFDARTKRMLLRRLPPGTTCPSVFRRCLPDYATIINKDQTQLLYARIVVTYHGSRAEAALGGTAVGRALRSVTLRDKRGVWHLTSFGHEIETCHLHRRHGGHGHRTSRAA
jgi:hypothetical protein